MMEWITPVYHILHLTQQATGAGTRLTLGLPWRASATHRPICAADQKASCSTPGTTWRYLHIPPDVYAGRFHPWPRSKR